MPPIVKSTVVISLVTCNKNCFIQNLIEKETKTYHTIVTNFQKFLGACKLNQYLYYGKNSIKKNRRKYTLKDVKLHYLFFKIFSMEHPSEPLADLQT